MNATDTIVVCRCGAPLIATFVFSYREWYCLECGRSYEFFDDFRRVPVTDELEAERERLIAEFVEIADPIIVSASRRVDCERCKAGSDHATHATPEEVAASKAAWERLRERRTR